MTPSVAALEFRFKAQYDEAYRLELAKLGANPITACGCQKQKAGMRALNRLMDDDLADDVRLAAANRILELGYGPARRRT